jgi:hypothetical protein
MPRTKETTLGWYLIGKQKYSEPVMKVRLDRKISLSKITINHISKKHEQSIWISGLYAIPNTQTLMIHKNHNE